MCVFGSSVRMQVCFLLLLIQLHITEGCWLEGNKYLIEISAYTGGSVLLPCSCTDLQTTPETFTWEKLTTNEKKWVKISPESEQYKERFQLVNDRSSGNLSLLISHLTEEDGGLYSCSVQGSQYTDIRLTVKGCTLNLQPETVTGYVGQSVLLPCSCSELQAKPHNFTWTFLNGSPHKEIFPEDQTNLYTDRVQLFNDHLPGNLSLLISHLTVEDGGRYRCEIRNRISDVRLTVRGKMTFCI
ncbi:carcinoembryonic antigen-related cell adhesion molecule 2-like [Neoarius graeffei]|uniref:carcinoembryonic antigen-related cell adhesion molecule 2-like n=1 Tax=Neoarius graeffei TaxID=443677 RepID=UPI00298BD1A5|nr:carcinoembryonic antigen-related cell adhesion molecule 2-like [Neoarius graeffei]XP_060758305.1 carcinoembryonic antigen-related cell adhesion molecule 2-like [Neoarius graeffei]